MGKRNRYACAHFLLGVDRPFCRLGSHLSGCPCPDFRDLSRAETRIVAMDTNLPEALEELLDAYTEAGRASPGEIKRALAAQLMRRLVVAVLLGLTSAFATLSVLELATVN
jgi:hypothetical protein